MKDLPHPKWMYLKAVLFLVIGLSCALMIFGENPTIRIAVLLAALIWSMCRAYYFAFYVIEHYIDPGYRFSGLFSFFRYAVRKLGSRRN